MFFFGGLGYFFYGFSQYIVMKYSSLKWLAVMAGGVLGVSAACLWTAQGACTLGNLYNILHAESRGLLANYSVY